MVDNYKKEIEELNKLREDQDKPEYTAEVRDQNARLSRRSSPKRRNPA